MSNDSLLIVGVDGLLGQEIFERWRGSDRNVLATSRRFSPASGALHLDLNDDPLRWPDFRNCRSAVICAGIGNQKTCWQNPIGTRHVNVTQTLRLANRLLDAGCFVVFLSTNLVFDGIRPLRASDAVLTPMTEYGRQKAEIEAGLLLDNRQTAIVRLTKVFHPRLPLIVNWIGCLKRQIPINAFNNYVCAPISLDLTVSCIGEIAEKRLPGIWQLSSPMDVSYAEIASYLVARNGLNPALVRATEAIDEFEHLPHHTTLDSSRVSATFGVKFETPFELLQQLFCQ